MREGALSLGYCYRFGFDGVVAGVEGGSEGEEGGDATGHLGDVADFFEAERALELFDVAVVEPLFDDGIAADGEGPYRRRDVLPVGGVAPPETGGAGVRWRLVAPDAAVADGDGEVVFGKLAAVAAHGSGDVARRGGWVERHIGAEKIGDAAAQGGAGLQ